MPAAVRPLTKVRREVLDSIRAGPGSEDGTGAVYRS